jgi:hypothetical protein
MFVRGQQYSIVLNLDLPESNINKDLGKVGKSKFKTILYCCPLTNIWKKKGHQL